jgi:hypothetical protein
VFVPSTIRGENGPTLVGIHLTTLEEKGLGYIHPGGGDRLGRSAAQSRRVVDLRGPTERDVPWLIGHRPVELMRNTPTAHGAQRGPDQRTIRHRQSHPGSR